MKPSAIYRQYLTKHHLDSMNVMLFPKLKFTLCSMHWQDAQIMINKDKSPRKRSKLQTWSGYASEIP